MTVENSQASLMWAAWHRTASESLVASVRDGDPVCVVAFSADAISAGREALKAAENPRQRAVTEALLDAAHAIRTIGKKATSREDLERMDKA